MRRTLERGENGRTFICRQVNMLHLRCVCIVKGGDCYDHEAESDVDDGHSRRNYVVCDRVYSLSVSLAVDSCRVLRR